MRLGTLARTWEVHRHHQRLLHFPFISGSLSQHSTWRWVNMPIGGVPVLPLIAFLVYHGAPLGAPSTDQLQRKFPHYWFLHLRLVCSCVYRHQYSWSDGRIGILDMATFYTFEYSPFLAFSHHSSPSVCQPDLDRRLLHHLHSRSDDRSYGCFTSYPVYSQAVQPVTHVRSDSHTPCGVTDTAYLHFPREGS